MRIVPPCRGALGYTRRAMIRHALLATVGLAALAASAGGRAAEEAAAPANGSTLPPGALRAFSTMNRALQDAALSPDGKTLALAVGGASPLVLLVEIDGDKPARRLAGHTGNINRIVFSPDGKRLASASEDMSARVWDLASDKLESTLLGHGMGIDGIAFSPDGAQVATASKDATIKLWDAASGSCLHTFEGHEAEVAGLDFSRDGRTILTEASDVTARLWDAGRRQPVRVLPERDGQVPGLAISPDGRLGVTTRGDRTWHLFAIPGGEDVQVLAGQTGNGSAAVFHPDGQSLITGCLDGSIRRWDLRSGQEIGWWNGATAGIRRVAIDGAGRRMVSLDFNGNTFLWDLAAPPPLPDGAAGEGDPADLERLWMLMRSEDYRVRTGAMRGFLKAPARAVPFLAEKVPPPQAADPAPMARLLARLNSESYAERERATEELRELDADRRQALLASSASAPPEARARVAAGLSTPLPRGGVRETLALEALGFLARERKDGKPTPEAAAAKAHLEKVAAGARGHSLAVLARAILDR